VLVADTQHQSEWLSSEWVYPGVNHRLLYRHSLLICEDTGDVMHLTDDEKVPHTVAGGGWVVSR
jgi:hypothetical protein